MSERYPSSNPEQHISSQERESITHEAAKKHHEQSKAEEKKQSKEEIYKQLEVALANKEARKKEVEKAEHHERPHHYITKSVKRGVYKHTIKNVQTHLKPTERRFSKIVHNDTVESLSELGANTVARPNAILGGGIVMVFGGLALLLTARYFGFTIPMSSLIALYVIGFILLLLVDILVRPFRKRFSKKN